MKATLSQLSRRFSDFGKNIAPAYYHDRCERSVQMRLYSMHKRDFVIVFAAFFMSFGLCFFIGLAGPSITKTIVQDASDSQVKLNGSQFATGPFLMKSPSLSRFAQQLWVIGRITLQENDDEKFKKPFKVQVIVHGISDANKDVFVLGKYENKTRSRELQCFGSTCNELMLLHLGYLDYSRYLITVHFFGLEKIEENYKIQNVEFYFRSYNPSYTHVEIWFRFIFMVIALGVMCWFYHCLRPFIFIDWSIEQKWVSLLLPLLILFDDPTFPLTFLVDSWFPRILDSMFQVTFLCTILLYWTWFYHGIRQNERTCTKFYAPKFILIGLLWLGAMVLASWQKRDENTDPTYDYKLDNNYYMVLVGFFFGVGFTYLAYLLFLIIKAFTELRSMPYFDVRLKFATAMVLIIIVSTVGLETLKFGISVIRDNFMSELDNNFGTSVVFMSYYSLMNAYIITLAYAYAPPKRAFFDMRVKDNPTLSMINDSDEDVIYGSDSESHPLNSISKGQDKEESD